MTGVFTNHPTSRRSTVLRAFYARYVAATANVRDPRIERAFAAVPREAFAGPAPWFILASSTASGWSAGAGYIETPNDDPAFLYQDVLLALDPARGINIGQPSLHAQCLDALAPRDGETVVHVGAGSGYYTAILAHLVGPGGQVHAFEIDPVLAPRAERNLAHIAWVELHARSGAADALPAADCIYVNAGITQPGEAWLQALRPGGRLLFPLQPERDRGGMLLVQKPFDGAVWPARFVSRAAFISCQAPQVDQTGHDLAAAFAGGGWEQVKALQLRTAPDHTSWFAAENWWLSTAAPQTGAS